VRSLKRQQGLSTLGWLVAVLVAGFFLRCIFIMAPAYADNRYLQEALRGLGESGTQINEMTEREIYKNLDGFFRINNLRSISAKSAKIERQRGKTLVSFEYEVRLPLLLNVDVVMSFHSVLDSSNADFCCRPITKPEK
jgi:hypothetical protein